MRLSIKRASSFCNIAVLCYFYVKRVVSRCDILVLLGKNATTYLKDISAIFSVTIDENLSHSEFLLCI